MVFEIYKDNFGEWRWRLKSSNGEIVADSGEGYKNRKDAIEIIVKIKRACKEDKAEIHIKEK